MATTTIPKGSWQVYTRVDTFSANTQGNWIQNLHRWNLTAGYVEFAWEVVRASDASLIVDGSVTAVKIAAGSITSNEIAANTIVAGDIAAGTITATQIAAATITAANIAAATITAANIATDTITADKIAANAITATEIAASAITTDKINAGAITAAKLATTELITVSAQIKDAVITSAKIGDLQVKSAQIDDLTVGTNKITGQAVTVPITYTGADATITSAGGIYTVLEMPSFIAVGDANGGGVMAVYYATFDGSWYEDAGQYINFYADYNNGSGYILLGSQTVGTATTSGDTRSSIPIAIAQSSSGIQYVKYKITVQVIKVNTTGGTLNPSYHRSIKLAILGAKR